MILPKLIFAYLASMIVAMSVVAVTRRNPVHSILFMLILFFHVAALYLTLNAEFLAAIQIIVYAGAILVLFIFVVLMLNLKEEISGPPFVGWWPAGLLMALLIFGGTVAALRSVQPGATGTHSIELIKSETHTVLLGKVLYTEFLFPFEVASVILLVAIVGAIVLAKKRLKS